MSGAVHAVDRAAFSERVQDAINHLYDHARLQVHPLARLLEVGPGGESSGRTLHRTLLEAVEELKPSEGVPRSSPAWRKYRSLLLRHLQGLTMPEIARELGVCARQARRDHQEAVEALVSLLWERHRDAARASAGAGPPDQSGPNAEALEAEMARVSAAWPPEPSDAREVVAGALATIARLAAARGVSARSTLPPGLPAAAVSSGALRQALVGALTMAVAAAPDGEVTVSAGPERPDSLELRIAARRGRAAALAQPRGEPPHEPDGSLGVSQRLLETQGASLELRDEGADRFAVHIRLPRTTHVTVMVVDDNPDFVRLVHRYLGGGRFRVVGVTEAAEALPRALECRPRAILLDVMMPLQDGWDLLQRLKNDEATREIPVVVCSVLREPDLALSLGATASLAKPLTQQALLTAVERCLASAASPGSPGRTASTRPR